MATNKTRIAVLDYSTAQPAQSIMQTDFDIYAEAIDYVETTIALSLTLGALVGFVVYVYSYDNPSYQYLVNTGGTYTKTEITFPTYA